MLKPEDILRYM